MADILKKSGARQEESPVHLEQRIRERAYHMWKMEGCPEGRADQYWLRAKEMIESEANAAYPPPESRGNRN
jgi:hypothetical protein